MFKKHGEVVRVGDLFAKYKNILQPPQKSVELESIRVIGEVANIKLSERQVEYTPSSRVLAIKASSLLKQEVKMKNRAILDELKDRLGAKNCPKHIL